jgi:DNA-3-methyladenine glycosylase
MPPFAPIGHEFFTRDALEVARELIGAYLVVARPPREKPARKTGSVGEGRAVRAVRIVETEAYRGPTDGASHARAGLTRRTRTLFGPPGHAYVFLVYGMHDCFNVVCFGEGKGHAVLIRAGEPTLGILEQERTDGPGRVARALGLSRADDGKALRRAARGQREDRALPARRGRVCRRRRREAVALLRREEQARVATVTEDDRVGRSKMSRQAAKERGRSVLKSDLASLCLWRLPLESPQ